EYFGAFSRTIRFAGRRRLSDCSYKKHRQPVSGRVAANRCPVAEILFTAACGYPVYMIQQGFWKEEIGMHRIGIFLSCAVLFSSVSLLNAQAAQNPEVTFYKDALPVFQQKCQTCHRTGQVAPFSLETYETARPWAKAIKEAILSRKMPPAQGF